MSAQLDPSLISSVDDGLFDRFIDGLLPSNGEFLAARYAADLVAEALRNSLPNADPLPDRPGYLVAGSIGKCTAIRPLPPLDLLYLMPLPLPPHKTLPSLLDRLEEVLDGSFPGAELQRKETSVIISSDGLSVQVYPSAEGRQGFAFPLTDRWTLIHPNAELAAQKLSDAVSGGAATRLLALLKSWRDTNHVPLSSFALEVMTREFLGQNVFSNWKSCFTDFLAWARQRTPKRYELPGGVAWDEAMVAAN